MSVRLVGYVRHLGEGVDGPGVGAARHPHDGDDVGVPGPASGDGFTQRGQVHPPAVVGRHANQPALADPQEAGRLGE